MTRMVCIRCDQEKLAATRVSDADWCVACGTHTPNRAIGADDAPIAPQSALTFARQRELFLNDRRS